MTCVIEVTEKHSGIQSPNKKGVNQQSLIYYILLLSHVVICTGILSKKYSETHLHSKSWKHWMSFIDIIKTASHLRFCLVKYLFPCLDSFVVWTRLRLLRCIIPFLLYHVVNTSMFMLTITYLVGYLWECTRSSRGR